MGAKEVAFIVIIGLLGAMGLGFAAGLMAERTYQCDRLGGEIAGQVCVRGHEVVIDWR